MRVTDVSMEQRRNERVGETDGPRENPPTNGIVRLVVIHAQMNPEPMKDLQGNTHPNPCHLVLRHLLLKSPQAKGSKGRAFAVPTLSVGIKPAFALFAPREVSVLVELALGHLRYHLTDVPPQPNSPPGSVLGSDHTGACATRTQATKPQGRRAASSIGCSREGRRRGSGEISLTNDWGEGHFSFGGAIPALSLTTSSPLPPFSTPNTSSRSDVGKRNHRLILPGTDKVLTRLPRPAFKAAVAPADVSPDVQIQAPEPIHSQLRTVRHRENPPTRDIVRHVSHVRKSGSNPAGNRARFVLVGGELRQPQPPHWENDSCDADYMWSKVWCGGGCGAEEGVVLKRVWCGAGCGVE
ncbi:hypothetical protein PR048_003192 [Dryococelus australis]|uniref:Senescence-associated protein n=1 Tax=Dryococelus australis TaxID=614101 RepID=A0ABQ9IMG0_9NEOP|nr:hypothetical protein PR048_003192 [Dryococelus australis]